MAFRGGALGSRGPVATGERLLQAVLRKQRERGVASLPKVIESELRQYEAAVRVQVAQLLSRDGAA